LLKDPYCAICASPEVETEYCSREHADDFFDKVNSVGIYYQKCFNKGDLLSDHILKLKNDRTYAEPIGKSMGIVAREIYPDLLESDGIVFIPLYIAEFAIRGFNQSLELAKVLRRETNLPIICNLEKTRMHSQRNLNFSARREAVDGLYQIQDSDSVKDKKLIIVDDVFTSGATCSEIAKILKSANAKSVRVFVAGRTNYRRG
jgi:predicted amidophosphoribosyltransferase